MSPTLVPLVGQAAPRRIAPRVQAIDIVRGLVMVIMALDHTREFWCPTPIRPEDVAHASVLLFLTRWITHFCAPTFIFLSGTSIWLYQQKQLSRRAVSKFLLTRGCWLIMLELVVINFIIQWGSQAILLQVIWVIGWSMVLLAGLLWLPRWLLMGLAGIILLGHNLLPDIAAKMIPVGHNLLPTIAHVTAASVGWAFLHNGPFVLPIAHFPTLLVGYSIGPWLAVLLAGYLLGPWFRLALPQRTKRLQWAGTGLLVVFGLLRATNWYGDPQPWSPQPRGFVYSILSFVNVTKYPPSLLYLCLILGVALLLLSAAERAARWPAQTLRTFGQVPFFYYLLHFALISGAAWVWTRMAFGQPHNFFFAAAKDFPPAYHVSLLRVYGVWVVLIVLLYWPCRWYQRYKQRHAYWWLSYL